MRLIPFVLFSLVQAVLWYCKKINCFHVITKQSSSFFRKYNIPCNPINSKNLVKRRRCENDKKKLEHNKLYFSHYDETERGEKGTSNINLKDQEKNVVNDIQGVWKFYLPVFIMDKEFEMEKGNEHSESQEVDNKEETDNSEDLDDFKMTSKKDRKAKDEANGGVREEISDSDNLGILRGERMHPLPMFVYNYEEIVSASNTTYAYWSNEPLEKNIYQCTIKIINKMNNKYMIILQGYLFISNINAINDKNIRLMPCQIFGNLFLSNNDSVEKKSLIPPNMKLYDKKGNEVKDILSILEKKLPEFRKDKKKIDSFLGLRKWKFLGVSTAYKIVGEGKNIFNINHFLTGKDENIFYNVMDFDTVNTNYNKKGFIHLKEIFNSYFEKPSSYVLSSIMENLQEKSVNGPF
ncbi:conserved Plasmodium protein, unknown function [Plasmodium malariae]|uniref:Uncharacterized protein n=1 Tax=Plasmodium malariae TaxID=5858 RepID=A0A1D3JKW4_PLAMA|nr:conserved Plasmodium protein, unknown function [Plasmodium malariae]SBT87188.1 conserved Plasmodium protein, unknown function [Plasmodium malariae]